MFSWHRHCYAFTPLTMYKHNLRLSILPFYRRPWSPLPFAVLPFFRRSWSPLPFTVLLFYRRSWSPLPFTVLPFCRLPARFLTGPPVSKRHTQRQHRLQRKSTNQTKCRKWEFSYKSAEVERKVWANWQLTENESLYPNRPENKQTSTSWRWRRTCELKLRLAQFTLDQS